METITDNPYDQNLEIKTTSITDEYDVDWNQKLGTGISGPVRVATKRSTGEKFAVKVVVDRAKARQEVQMHWKCSGHPHVVSLYEVYRNDLQFPGESVSQSRLLLVLELMDGGELFFRISKQHGFTERHAAGTTMQIALAVKHLHGKNIAHRDLKPENLLYKSTLDDSPIKLCDFGFAKLDNGDLMTPQFTPYYVSPQASAVNIFIRSNNSGKEYSAVYFARVKVLEAQRRHRRERTSISTSTLYTYDKSCDMWSLGVIIYILMCGYPPFYSEHPSSRRTIDKSMRRKIMNGSYNFPEREWERVSDRAKDVVKRLLCVDPHERMSIEDLVQHSWLTEEAPDTLLQSPMFMTNKELPQEVFQEAKLQEVADLHESHLRKMRIVERPIDLKPFESVINPILVRRQQLNRQGEVPSPLRIAPVEDPTWMRALRDVIATLLFPVTSSDLSEQQSVTEEAVRAAISSNKDNSAFSEILENHRWDGDHFVSEINSKKLCRDIKEVLQSAHATSDG